MCLTCECIPSINRKTEQKVNIFMSLNLKMINQAPHKQRYTKNVNIAHL
jgi:hypothetical protein